MSLSNYHKLIDEINHQKNPVKAKNLSRFFKTGPGDYGAGDMFYGLTVPQCRLLVKKYHQLSFYDIKKLIQSKVHEIRLIGLLILVDQFNRGQAAEKKTIYKFYIANTKYINNWDLVDLTAHKIVGAYLIDKDQSILNKLARSNNLWQRRIAVISTFYFINKNKYNKSLELAEILLNDKHDLIHKAVGWMLREIGKRSLTTEQQFLNKHDKQMPRTMLRYAIKKFLQTKRKQYLAK